MGITSEDILVQIYETIFRDVCPRNLSLAQLIDSIAKKISKILKHPKIPDNPQVTLLFEKIKNLQKKNIQNKQLLILIRDLLSFIKQYSKYVNYMIKDVDKNENNFSIFPKYIREYLNDLIRYRNAISHRSRIPIGNYEGLKSVYITFILYRWWLKENKQINWKESKIDIINNIIQRNIIHD